MTQNTDADDATPVHEQTIRAVAERHDVPERDVRELLNQIAADIHDHALRSEFDDLHDFRGTSKGVRVYLCDHGLEVDELASAAADQIRAEFPRDASAATVARMAFDYDLRERHYPVVGGRDEAVGATGAMDALLVRDA